MKLDRHAAALIVILAVAVSLTSAAPVSAQLGLPVADPVGVVVGATGDVLGTLDETTGQIVGDDGSVVGTLDPVTGQIVDAVGNVIGTVDETTGQIVDGAGNLVGTVVPTAGGGTGTAPRVPGAPGTAPGATAPGALSVSVSAPPVQRFSTARRRGVSASSRCSAACAVLYALTVDARTARALRLGRAQTTVGSAAAAGGGRLAIRFVPRARRALERYMPTSAALRRLRASETRARRAARSARTRAARTRARRRAARLRARRVALTRRNLVVTLRGLAFDATGGAVAPRTRSIRLRG